MMQRAGTLQLCDGKEAVGRLGRYDLLTVLARGGMGDVHLAVLRGPVGFNKLLVVKELPPETLEDDANLAMFLDEARLAARLNHPNIVQTLEVGVDGRRRFIAMEHIDGQPLSRLLHRARERGIPLPLPMLFHIVVDLLTALAYAHTFTDFDGTALGIVHCDVSPQNVLVTYEGHVKLIDFGIARMGVASQQTRAGVLKGKLKYMSPEQALCGAVDGRADVFAAGAMLWEGIVGTGPWHGSADLPILRALVAGNVPRLADARPDLDPDLVAIVDHAMSPDPSSRFPTALAMRDALEHYVTGHGLSLGRELPPFISVLFREDRRALRSLIDAQLRGLADQSPVEVLSGSGKRSIATPPNEDDPARLALLGGRAAADDPLDAAPASHVRRTARGSGYWVAGGLSACAALSIGAFHLSRPALVRMFGQSTAQSASPAPSSALPPPPSPPPAPVDARRTVHVFVRATPAWAQISVDDLPVVSPYVAEREPDSAPHRLQAEAPGYVGQTLAATFDRDITISVALERAPSAKAPRAMASTLASSPPIDSASEAKKPPPRGGGAVGGPTVKSKHDVIDTAATRHVGPHGPGAADRPLPIDRQNPYLE